MSKSSQLDVKKPEENVSPIVYEEKEPDYWADYPYGSKSIQLRPGVEVEDNGSVKRAVGSSSRSTTGLQTITVGFKPKIVRINAVYASSAGGVSIGSATSPSSQFNVNSFANPSAASWSTSALLVSVNWTGAGTTNGSLSEFTDSGFVINWTSIGPPISFTYEAEG